MGIKCQCVIESKQMIGVNISNKPIIMSGEKNDWFATLDVSGMECNDFAQVKVCDTMKLVSSIVNSHKWKCATLYETGIKYNDFTQMKVFDTLWN